MSALSLPVGPSAAGGRRYGGCWHAAVDFLAAAGADVLFGLPADDLALLEALDGSALRLVVCRDQRNAAFMATGYALQSGRAGVCVVGKGPAITNTLTGLLEARSGAAPLLLLATGTAAGRWGSGAFQELDQVSCVRPHVKWAHRVDDPSRVPAALEKAWAVATSGAPGPVYLEFPEQLADAPVERVRPWAADPERSAAYAAAPGSAARAAVATARRCVVLVGGGMRHRNAGRLVEPFAERTGAAIFATASGRGTVDEDHPQFLGLAGLYLRPAARDVWADADLVVALGSRLEETATHGWVPAADAPPVVQVNVAAEEFSAEFGGPRVVGDGAHVLEHWLETLPAAAPDRRWLAGIHGARHVLEAEARDLAAAGPVDGRLRVAAVLAAVDRTVPADRVLVQENGLQDMWSYLFPVHRCPAGAGSVVPSEQTSLGFGVAASAGVALAAPGRQVVAFVGDGAFDVLAGDLATLAAERTGVLFVVLDNGGYGWLQAQLQKLRPATGPFRFADDRRRRGPGEDDPRIRWAVADTVDGLERQLRAAVRHCADGGVAVVRVPVALADAPPGIAEVLDAAGCPGSGAELCPVADGPPPIDPSGRG